MKNAYDISKGIFPIVSCTYESEVQQVQVLEIVWIHQHGNNKPSECLKPSINIQYVEMTWNQKIISISH